MAQNSKIEWTHNTFNPWWGCIRVSPACKHCYADTWARRLGLDLWSARSQRRFFGDAHWREPLKWDRAAAKDGERHRVFCASMADVFEKRRELDGPRSRLWRLIESTPNLDWLLLTKRPEYVASMTPWGTAWPRNVWLGTTAENQHWADKRIPLLLESAARVKFISAEPLLGPLRLEGQLLPADVIGRGLNWVIAGGESGPHARPMNPAWVESLRDECAASGTAFHFKQWGHWGPDMKNAPKSAHRVQVIGRDGRPVTLVRLGKQAAGRRLDGRTWDGLPFVPLG
jgi:protein gp37